MAVEHGGPSSTIEAVRRLYRRIAALPGLAPGPRTGAAFTELVRLATTPTPVGTERQVLADPAVRALAPHLQRLCGEAEIELARRAHSLTTVAGTGAKRTTLPG